MYCPKCGATLNNEYPFCTECGAPLTAPRANKGSLWPPLIFMAIMLIVGIAVFLAYPAESTASPMPDAPWFQEKDGIVTFDEALYNGSPALTVPDGVTGLAEDCFYDCDKLETVLLPDSLTEVGSRAFAQCDQLRGIKLPDGVTQIGDSAFQDCAVLEALAIPASIETIGSDAFAGCGALRHIFFDGTKQQWQALNVGNFGTETTIYCVDGNL